MADGSGAILRRDFEGDDESNGGLAAHAQPAHAALVFQSGVGGFFAGAAFVGFFEFGGFLLASPLGDGDVFAAEAEPPRSARGFGWTGLGQGTGVAVGAIEMGDDGAFGSRRLLADRRVAGGASVDGSPVVAEFERGQRHGFARRFRSRHGAEQLNAVVAGLDDVLAADVAGVGERGFGRQAAGAFMSLSCAPSTWT
jgi:hypothetical protein